MAALRARIFVLIFLTVFIKTSVSCIPSAPTPTPTTTQTPTQSNVDICCGDRQGSRNQPNFSPFNRGLNSSDYVFATVCYYYKGPGCVVCRGPGSQDPPTVTRCCTEEPTGSVPELPRNEYLITHDEDINRYDLSPLALTGDNYQSPYQLSPGQENTWTIHREGTPSANGVTIVTDSCWFSISETVKDGSFIHPAGIEVKGFLFVLDPEDE